MADFGIMSAAPGEPQNAGTSDDIAHTVADAVTMAYARRDWLESHSQGQGAVVGDALPLTGPVDYDTTLLMPLPGVPITPPGQGGSYTGVAPYEPAGSSLMGGPGAAHGDDGSNIGGRG